MTDKPRPIATPTIKKKGKDLDLIPAAPTTGQSRFRFADNTIYEGEWKLVPDITASTPLTGEKVDKNAPINQPMKRVRHGQGTFIHPNGTTYTGTWNDDKMEGAGILTFSNGSYQAKYAGDFVNNQYHGKGRFEWPDGSHYEGDWLNGKMQGHGELVICDESNNSELHRFVGTFLNDQFVNENGQWIAPHVPLHYS